MALASVMVVGPAAETVVVEVVAATLDEDTLSRDHVVDRADTEVGYGSVAHHGVPDLESFDPVHLIGVQRRHGITLPEGHLTCGT